MKISVIVPVWNVEDYIDKCLDSLVHQTLKDIEIIVVNDGSPDNSEEIIKKYEKKYKSIKYVVKKNGVLSDARNFGLKYATGEYISFVDSDDWLVPDAIRTLHDFAVRNQCEIVQAGFYYAYSDRLEFDNRWVNENTSPYVLDNFNAIAELVKQQIVKNFVWAKIYERSIVQYIPFKLGAYRQDSFWQHQVMAKVKRYGIIPQPIYYYRQRQDSLSGQFSIRSLDLLKGHEERLLFLKTKYPDLVMPMAALLWKQAFQFNEAVRHSQDEKTKEAFGLYFSHINQEYHDTIAQALRYDLTYQITRLVPALGQFCLLGKRIFNHFFATRLKTIPLQ